MKKLFQKRAQEYNSDEDDDDKSAAPAIIGSVSLPSISKKSHNEEDIESEEFSEEEAGGYEVRNENTDDFQNGFADDEGEKGGIQPGITKFTEDCRAFRMAFRSIIKKSVSDDSLGPVFSGYKKLVIDKLAEEEAEHKVKGEAKKENQMLAEKGHVKPATYLDSHEKFLTSVATKGGQQGTNCSERIGCLKE